MPITTYVCPTCAMVLECCVHNWPLTLTYVSPACHVYLPVARKKIHSLGGLSLGWVGGMNRMINHSTASRVGLQSLNFLAAKVIFFPPEVVLMGIESHQPNWKLPTETDNLSRLVCVNDFPYPNWEVHYYCNWCLLRGMTGKEIFPFLWRLFVCSLVKANPWSLKESPEAIHQKANWSFLVWNGKKFVWGDFLSDSKNVWNASLISEGRWEKF